MKAPTLGNLGTLFGSTGYTLRLCFRSESQVGTNASKPLLKMLSEFVCRVRVTGIHGISLAVG